MKNGNHINIKSKSDIWQKRMEVHMKDSGVKLNKEKIFGTIISLAIILTLGYGIISVAVSSGKKENKENIVNLNESQQDNVALHTEDVDEEYPDVLQVPEKVSSENEAEAANAGAKAEGLSAAQENIDTEIKVKEEKSQEESEAAKTSAKANEAAAYSFSESDTLIWPVTGEIILKYSMDTTIYFKTLGMYKCNPAISIAAEKGTNVGVAADGIVESVTYSEETGNTVAVAIGDGYVTTYGLMDNVVVKKGDKVTAGQLLGTVAGPTAYYVEEGCNLYFMLTKDGEPVDPAAYFED